MTNTMRNALRIGTVLLLVLIATVCFACNKDTSTTYKVTFYVDGAVYDTVEVGTGSIKMPANPTKDGYVFDGWYVDQDTWKNAFSAGSKVSADLAVYAKWKEASSTPDTPTPDQPESSLNLTIEGFTAADDTLSCTLPSGSVEVDLRSLVQVATGTTYKVYADEACTQAVTTLELAAGNNTFYVVATGNKGTTKTYTLNVYRKHTYILSFITGIQETVADVAVEEGATATAPVLATTKAGHTFVGWDYDFTVAVSADATITAQWTVNTYTISFDMNDGAPQQAAVTVDYGAAMPTLTTVPTRTGYTFGGYVDANDTQYYAADLSSDRVWSTASDGTLVAKWIANTYTVSFAYADGQGDIAPVTATYGAVLPAIVGDLPTKDGYDFAGFVYQGTTYYNAAGEGVAAYQFTEGIELTAVWTAAHYQVDLRPLGGTLASNSATVVYGESYDLEVPTRTGYTFDGWYDRADYNVQGVQLTDAQGHSNAPYAYTIGWTMFAKWSPILSHVSFDSGEVEVAVPGTTVILYDTPAVKDEVAKQLDVIAASGYDFLGWYYGDVAVTDNEGHLLSDWHIAAATVTLTARWNTHTTHFVVQLNGETLLDTTLAYGAALPTLDKPTKKGYTFCGWFYSAACIYDSAAVAQLDAWSHDVASATLLDSWTPNVTAVSFAAGLDDDVHNMPAATSATYDAIVDFGAPDCVGYDFAGWYYGDTATTNVWAIDAATVTLTAHWTAHTTAITFDLNDGTGSIAGFTATYGQGLPATLTGSASRTGYELAGFYLGDSRIYDGDLSVSIGTWRRDIASATLVARWQAVNVNLSFDLNAADATGFVANIEGFTVTAVYGVNMPTLTTIQGVTLPTRAGYVFTGFYSAKEGGTQYYNNKLVCTKASDFVAPTTLYAQWDEGLYFVHFDANGGEGSMADQNIHLDATVALSANAFSKAGYSFIGWNTNAVGTAVGYDNNEQVCNLTDNGQTITLYAQWSVNTYSVTFDRMGGTGGQSGFSVNYDAVPDNLLVDMYGLPTRTGYTFVGYYSAEDEMNPYFDANGKAKRVWNIATASPVLYAHWTPLGTTLTFNNAGGSAVGSNTVYYDQDMPTITPSTRSGYTLLGYFDDALEGTQYYNADGTGAKKWTLIGYEQSGFTLYAHWEANTYTVSFTSYPTAGVEGTQAPVTATYGAAMPSFEVSLVRTGYHAVSAEYAKTNTVYYTIENGVATSAHEWDLSGDNTLTIYWAPNTYRILFDGNGATAGSQADVDVSYNGSVSNINIAFTRTGYTFDGYYTAAEGGTQVFAMYGAVQDDYKIWTRTQDLQVYAHWTPNKYNIYFYANNGTGSQSSVKATYDQVVPDVTVGYSRIGYTFAGFTNYDRTVTYYDKDGKGVYLWQSTTDVNIYAQWTANTYTVSFEMRGGSPQQADVTVTYGQYMPDVISVMPTKQYYKFRGYYNEEGTICFYRVYNGKVEPYVQWNHTTGGTLYAEWENGAYTIEYLANGATSGTYVTDSYTNNIAETLRSSGYNRTGYTLSGWNTQADGKGTHYDLGAEVTNLADNGELVTLYAEWTPKSYGVSLSNKCGQYTLSFDLNGASVAAVPSQTINEVNPITYPIPAVWAGHLFAGWYKELACTNEFSFSSNLTEDTTVYAKWVAYDGEGTIFNVCSENAITVTTSDQTFVFYGLIYGYYDISVKGKQAQIVCNDTTYSGGWTGYLDVGTQVFAVHSYNYSDASDCVGAATLTINRVVPPAGGHAGNAPTIDTTAVYGSIVDFSDYTPTAVGFDFGGWFTGTNGTGTQITDANGIGVASYSFNYNVTLYAYWVGKSFTATFDVNGGDEAGTPTSATVWFDSIVSDLHDFVAPTKDRYDFAGYFDAATGGSRYYNADGTANENYRWLYLDHTLYAHWNRAKYTVVYDGNGADGGAMSNTQLSLDVYGWLSGNSYTRTGYTFVGWNSQADGNGNHYDNNAYVINLENPAAHDTVTLYAEWTPNSYEAAGISYCEAGNAQIVPVAGQVMRYLGFVSDIAQNVYIHGADDNVALDTKGWLFTGEGEYLAYDDDSGPSAQFGIHYTLEAGTLYILGIRGNYSYSIGNIFAHIDAEGAGSEQSALHIYAYTAFGATYDAAYTWAPPAHRTGYDFVGWYSTASGEGVQYTDAAGHSLAAWTGTDSLAVVHARYTVAKVEVTFDANGGTGGSAALEEVTYGEATPTISVAPTRAEYVFIGYYTTAEGGTMYYNADLSVAVATWDIDEDVVLYAHWTPTFYYVAFDANGGTGSMDNQKIFKDASTALTAAAFSRTNYDFAGWNTQADGLGTSYADEASVTNLADVGDTITLYAKWAPKSYTVAFKANDGTGSMGNQTLYYGVEANLSANTFTRTGYRYLGWNTQADGSGDGYADGAAVTDIGAVGSTVTLYAQWEIYQATVTLDSVHPVPATVSFNLNGAMGLPPADQEVTWNIGLYIPATPTWSDHVFLGWYDNAACEGSPYDFSADVSADVTLYAKWVDAAYAIAGYIPFGSSAGLYIEKGGHYYYPIFSDTARTVYFHSEGSNDSDPQGELLLNGARMAYCGDIGGGDFNFGFEYTLAANTLYYLHVYGYSADTEGATTIYVGGTAYAAGGVSAKHVVGTTTITYGTTPAIDPLADMTGFTFDGWYDGEGGTGTKYVNADGTNAHAWDKEVTACVLYAKWTAATTTVSFDANEGTGGPAGTVTASYGSDMPAISDMPTRSGMVITGYWDSAYGGTKYYNADLSSARKWDKTAAATTLYAQWENEYYFVRFNPNGADGEAYTQRVYREMGDTLDPVRFERTGYYFMGWNTNPDGVSGTAYINGDGIMNLAEHGQTVDLYAVWMAKTTTVKLDDKRMQPVTVSFDLNGAPGEAPASQVVTASVGLSYPTNPTWKDHIFRGWYYESICNNYVEFSDERFDNGHGLTADVTLYAGWTEIPVGAKGVLTCGSETSITLEGETLLKFYIVSLVDQTVTFYAESGYDTIGELRDCAWDVSYASDDDSELGGGINFRFTRTLQAGVVYCLGVRGKDYTDDGICSIYVTGDADLVPTDGALSRNDTFYSDDLTFDDDSFSLPVPAARTGYTFRGWRNGGGTMYTDENGDAIRAWDIEDASYTLYAEWEPTSVTFTLDNQGGAGYYDEVDVPYGEYRHVGLPTKAGYEFMGYYDAAEGGKNYMHTTYAGYVMNYDRLTATTLYAHWAPCGYVLTLADTTVSSVTVSFDANGGSGAPAAQVLTDGDALTYPATIPTKAGHLFAGWYDNALCIGSPFDFTADVRYSVTLYAKWIAYSRCDGLLVPGGAPIVVTLNGRDRLYFPIVVLKTQTITFTSSGDLTGNGSRFDPYCILYNADLDRITYDDSNGEGDNFSLSHTLTAGNLYYLSPMQYYDYLCGDVSLTLDDIDLPTDGGTFDASATAKVFVTYGEAFTLLKPTKAGFTFGGWFTEEDGAGTQITDADGVGLAAWNGTSNTTLYAYWIAD